jgi:hypothetical protein
LAQTNPAERAAFRSPVPTRIISNGEFNPLPQTPQQRRFEARPKELADGAAKKLGLSRRNFLRTSGGMAAAFVALNDVFGRVYEVTPAEACEPEGQRRPGKPAGRPVHLLTTRPISSKTTMMSKTSCSLRNTPTRTGTRGC